MNIWTNQQMPDPVLAMLKAGIGQHRLLLGRQTNNLSISRPDLLLNDADIAFGQPDPQQVIALHRLRWVQLTTAGYTRYDRDDLRQAMRSRGAILTNSSTPYSEPCAQHAVAFMLAAARRLLPAFINQRDAKGWPSDQLRRESMLLNGQTVLLVGFGAIGKRIAELLAPFGMNLIGIRRQPHGDVPIHCCGVDRLDELLPAAHHVINLLPASSETQSFFNADRFRRFKHGAIFYNIGRGATVDSYALWTMLQTRKLLAAYLDVIDPEPLPPEHPLWSSPHCLITPHTAGGHAGEFESLVRHFLGNLENFSRNTPLLDRVI